MLKFWRTPKVVEKILPFLDLASIVSLGHSQVMDRKILKSATVWNQLIRRSSPLDDMEEVKKLVQILKLMKDPRTQMLDLLDLICGNKAGNSFIHLFGSVKLSCPRHPDSHLVHSEGESLLRGLCWALRPQPPAQG